jgi:AmmeMemoRadiSam system protein A
MAAMQAARELGAPQGVPISYANSGHSPVADTSRVVGYGAVMFVSGTSSGENAPEAAGPAAARAFPPLVSAGPATGDPHSPEALEADAAASPEGLSGSESGKFDESESQNGDNAGEPGATNDDSPLPSPPAPVASSWLDGDARPLTKDERQALLSFARETIHRFLTTETAPLARDYPPALARTQGIFVTLRKEGHNRGCRGNMRPDLPLYQLVGVISLQSAFNDSRFPTLRLNEIDEISLEISLLTPMAPVGGPAEVVVGRDGVLLTKDGRSAVYLPEVAVEMGWDRNEMLEHLCRKAGLPAGCWREGARFQTFQADVIKEAAARPH